MPRLSGKKFWYIVVFSFFFTITAACGSSDSEEDIAPVESIEAEVAPGPSPTPAPLPTPTDLPAEMVEPVSPVSPVAPAEQPTMTPVNSSVEPIPGGEEALAAAIANLSEQIGLRAGDIRLASMEAREWRDTSLGCPQEGFMYAQVITPGFLVMLEAQGQMYEYHTDRGANVVLCEE